MAFLDSGYLLSTESGEKIFETIEYLPIVDFHGHAEAQEIAKDNHWEDIWEFQCATDHYVWELMRRCGVPEEKITGKAPNEEKWRALAEVFPRFAGNPVYDWFHLDLRRRFGIQELLGPTTGEKIWQEVNTHLSSKRFKPRQLLREMNVEVLCTTDSPLSDLRWHRELRECFPEVRIIPTWRPDEVMRIGSQEWRDFLAELGERTGADVARFTGLIEALEKTHCHFADHGCVASDHGLTQPWGHYVCERTAAKIYEKAWHGLSIDDAERQDFHAYMLHFFAELNANASWTMQLHIGAVRDFRDLLFKSLGRDSGGDVATHNIELVHNLKDFLNEFDGRLQIVLYVLHPSHTYTSATLARAFPNVFLGAPWWFMDNPYHATNYLREVAAVDLLWRHAGMVTDSRKLVSIGSRTEMFRRVLANVLGEMVDQGRIPLETAGNIARQVAYCNPKSLVEKASDG